MKKVLKANLISSVAIFVVAAILLTGVTYAWFTSIANPDIQSIDLYVKAADALQLSAKTAPLPNIVADWNNSLPKVNITQSQGNSVFPDNMFNVSSLFDSTSHGFFTASHTGIGTLDGYSAVTSQPDNYAKFFVWVKSTRNGFVYLDAGSAVTAVAQSAPGNSISQTVRVGFVPVDTDGTTELWAKAVIWEPNSLTHLDTTYGGPGGTAKIVTSAVKNEVEKATPIDTDGLAAAVGTQKTFDFHAGDTNVNTGSTSADDSYVATAGTSAAKIALFNLSADVPQKFNVYIWVEGADGDAVNTVAKNTFSTYIRFGQQYDKTIS